jgi:hypothetical protein
MALARVVEFENVDSARMEQMRSQMQDSGRPDDVPATEILVLHDPGSSKSVVVLFFDSEEDYMKADAVLSAMPADDTPGKRSGVARYDVVFRMND